MTNKETIFIYGTLKRECKNNNVMKEVEGKYICEATTDICFPMYESSMGYPFLQKYTNGLGRKIKGEIWEVPLEKVERLNQFEGVPYLYKPIYIDCYDENNGLWASIMTYMSSKPLNEEDLVDMTLLEEWKE